ncbi:MAG: hypothetical protein WAW53_13315 [Candidatus Dormiibacterota bacterium]
MSSVPRHSEEELRQQWAFLDALVDRQAASLKSGIQDPEEEGLTMPMVTADPDYLEEISTLTQRVTSLEDERTTLLRRIDLSEEARIAAESARAAADAARAAAERALAEERSRPRAGSSTPRPPAPLWEPIPPTSAPAPRQTAERAGAAHGVPSPPKVTSPKARRKTWWQRIRD